MINLTDAAKQKIKQKILDRGRGLGILIGLKTNGCSGLSYVFEYLDQYQTSHECVYDNEVRIYVNSKHKNIFSGMTIDYVRKGLNEGFEFLNPNEGDRCGCGQSFTVKSVLNSV